MSIAMQCTYDYNDFQCRDKLLLWHEMKVLDRVTATELDI